MWQRKPVPQVFRQQHCCGGVGWILIFYMIKLEDSYKKCVSVQTQKDVENSFKVVYLYMKSDGDWICGMSSTKLIWVGCVCLHSHWFGHLNSPVYSYRDRLTAALPTLTYVHEDKGVFCWYLYKH